MLRMLQKKMALAVVGLSLCSGGLMAQEPVPEPPAPNPLPAVVKPPRTQLVKISALEQRLAAEAGKFNWEIHNELRHEYGAFDESKSFMHSNIILKNSVMDGYIVSILSGWELDKDVSKAIENLKASAAKFPEYKYVEAACLLKIADLVESDQEARLLYQKVVDLKGEGLEGYKKLASEVMAKLGNGGPAEDRLRERRTVPRKR